MVWHNTLFTMTQAEFNEILLQYKMENPNFVSDAIWSIEDSKEPDSINVKVAITKKIVNGDVNFEVHLSGKSLTQNNEDCVVGAISKLNEDLLSKLAKNDK